MGQDAFEDLSGGKTFTERVFQKLRQGAGEEARGKWWRLLHYSGDGDSNPDLTFIGDFGDDSPHLQEEVTPEVSFTNMTTNPMFKDNNSDDSICNSPEVVSVEDALDSDHKEECIFRAVEHGNVELLEAYAAHVGERDLASLRGANAWTPLHFAAHAGQVHCVEVLISWGADTEATTELEGWTPLHLAAQRGHAEVVRYCLETSPESRDAVDHLGRGPADLVLDHATLALFDANDVQDTYGRTLFGGTVRRSSRADHVQRVLHLTQYVPLGRSPERERALVVGSTESAPRKRAPFVSLRTESSLGNPGLKAFIPERLMGQGTFGAVYKVRKAHTNETYAMKVQEKAALVQCKMLDNVMAERNVLSYTDHPFIVKLYYAFQTSAHLALVLEFCGDGTLHDLIKRCHSLPKDLTRHYAGELTLAFEYLHRRNILYRDLKPENVVLRDRHCKLTDFGLVKESKDGWGFSFCGSAAYIAPEMLLKKGYTCSVDWYALGVLTYECTIGKMPFTGRTRDELFSNIQTAVVGFPAGTDPVVRNFIEALMDRTVKRRLGSSAANAVRDHELFDGMDWEAMLRMEVTVPARPESTPRPIWAESPVRRPHYKPNASADSETTPKLAEVRGWNYVRPLCGQF
jgi:serine/threonine protein kinase